MKPTFSVIIPVADDANLNFLEDALSAIFKQTYPVIEIILVMSKVAQIRLNTHFTNITNQPILFAIRENLSKSIARNTGAQRAKGNYLIHIDVDYVLPKSILAKVANLIMKEKTKAIILHETIKNPQTIWKRARKLERDIEINDIAMASPQIISKSLFNKIEGFDEEVDELDDWSIMAKLNREEPGLVRIGEIKSPLTPIDEPTHVINIMKRKFKKGRYLKRFQEKYPSPQTKFGNRLKVYWNHNDLYSHSPAIFIALVTLKIFDISAFYAGSLFPTRTNG